MIELQPNERRCSVIKQSHILSIENNCPVSKNPGKGSVIKISYEPDQHHLEVIALRKYIDSFIGGKGEIRSMEAMIAQIAKDCANSLDVEVTVTADLVIYPAQKMELICIHTPPENPW